MTAPGRRKVCSSDAARKFCGAQTTCSLAAATAAGGNAPSGGSKTCRKLESVRNPQSAAGTAHAGSQRRLHSGAATMAADPPRIAQWPHGQPANVSPSISRASSHESQPTSPTIPPAAMTVVMKADGSSRRQWIAISTATAGIASSRYRPDRCVGSRKTRKIAATQSQSNRSSVPALRRCCQARKRVPSSGSASNPAFVNHVSPYTQRLVLPQSRAPR